MSEKTQPPSIKEVMDSFHAYGMAASENESAQAGYEGYSWDYHGDDYLKRMEEAEKRSEEMLSKYIDHRIELALGKLMSED